MITIEDFRRAAAAAGEARLAAALSRVTEPRMPALLLAECERAAAVATADTQEDEQ